MNQFLRQIFLCVLFLGTSLLLTAQNTNTSPVLISDDPSSFVNGFSKANKTGKTGEPIHIKLSSSKNVELQLNVRNQVNRTLSLIGAVDQKEGSSFSFNYNNGQLEGHIIERDVNKAYKVYTANNKVYVKETDINAILCIAYEKAPQTAPSKNANTGSTSKLPPTTLQSRPSATAVIYLDFDGEVVSNTNWNSGDTIDAQPANLSDAEITNTWEIMAEDFSPFDINVVTDRSVFDATPRNRRMMVIFTPTDDAQPGSGGVAFLNSFSWDTEDPCWVYNIGNGRQAGDTGSHEVGHTMGLNHDGQGSTEYYEGHGTWAPIMGFSLNKPIGQWSLGEYNNATNTQNDIQIIANTQNNFGFAPDDHSDTTNGSTAIVADAGGNINGNDNKGIIRERDDIDMFSFLAQAGQASFTVEPHDVHPNLDIALRLLDAGGTEVANSNPSGLSASITTNLSEGLYFLEIQGTGSGTVDTGYSDYASLGQYSISGQYTVQTPENDIRLISITPEEGSLACGSIIPSIELINDGSNTISGFDIHYSINSGTQQTQSFSNTLAPQEELTVTLDAITLNSTGNATIEIIAQIANDDLPNNNTIEQNFFSNISGVAAQVNSFETASDALIAYDSSGDTSVWQRGIPTGSTLNAAANGANAYGTVLGGDYPDSKLSYLVTNCYDFSNIADPVLSFNMAYDIEINYDVLYVEYSLNAGETWSLLGSSNSQPNWYNSDRTPNPTDCQNCPGGQWTGTNATFNAYRYDFTANAGTETDLRNEDNIMFRFVFHSDEFVTEEGVVIDDFVIEGLPADDDDDDDDGVLDVDDNCPLTSNADQLNTDGDSMGNVCDDDDDNDGILDVDDNCPLTPNPNQADTDGDGIGDVCEDPNDDDGDGIINTEDNCPTVANENQEDSDDDGIGDVCDPDDDNDTFLDIVDNCPMTYNIDQLDTDNDGIGDVCDKDDDEDGILDEDDNCPLTPNPDQADSDGDGTGDVCDTTADDLDGDGITNAQDNCPNTANPDQLDSDNDGIGDVCDADDDNDTILDIVDNCPLTPNTDQADADNDGIGNVCDENEFSLPDSNYTFTSLQSCISGKGSLQIDASQDFRYQITLSGSDSGASKDFTESVQFEDLDPGDYTACITVDGQPDYEACFEITVVPSEEFTVVTEVDYGRLEVIVTLNGSETYEVTLNDETQTVSANEVILNLTEPVNTLQVTSDQECDLVYEETFTVNPEVLIYPNPIEGDEIVINLDGGVETELLVSLFAMRGTRISSKMYEIVNNQVRIQAAGLAKGVYILNVSTFNKTKTFKIIRN
jgi:hypothetical protein